MANNKWQLKHLIRLMKDGEWLGRDYGWKFIPYL